METDQQNLKFQFISPIKQPPFSLTVLGKDPQVQFILGYRHILVPSQNGWSWGFVKNSQYCGKAFVFQISEQEAHTIQSVKQQGEIIEIVANNYILLKNQKELQKSTEEISLEHLKKLFEDIGGVNKINLNVVKNAFNGLTQYQQMAGKAVSQLNFEDKKGEVSVSEQVKLQFNAKNLAGSSLLDLPEISKETGDPIQGKKLKISPVSV